MFIIYSLLLITLSLKGATQSATNSRNIVSSWKSFILLNVALILLNCSTSAGFISFLAAFSSSSSCLGVRFGLASSCSNYLFNFSSLLASYSSAFFSSFLVPPLAYSCIPKPFYSFSCVSDFGLGFLTDPLSLLLIPLLILNSNIFIYIYCRLLFYI